jgi:hypothetical protein
VEHIPARHAAKVGMKYPGRVWYITEYGFGLELDLTRFAPGRSPTLTATLRFDRTVDPERARRLAPGDPVEAVLIEVYLHPNNEYVIASLPPNPAWLSGSVRHLARLIRETGRSDLFPILADALEDAGCDDAALIDHCRQPHEDGERNWAAELLASQA